MRIFHAVCILFWRIWFYVLMGLPILILFPVLLLLTAREKWYPQFFRVARGWAKFILYGMGLFPKIETGQKLERQKSYMLVANHTSMIDIMLMFCVVKNPFVFVGKKELTKIPLFGFFYKRTCILVDRNSTKSRKEVFDHAQARLQQGLSLCIFPEGQVPDDESILLDGFKDGAFRLAIEHQIPVVPMVFFDNKKRFSYTFFSGSPGLIRAKILPFIFTEEKTLKDKRNLKEQTRTLILRELEADLSYSQLFSHHD